MLFQKLIDVTRSKYDSNGDPSHDFAHICRVIESCRKIGNSLGADLDVLLPAALMHDVVNVPKDHPDRVLASQKAAEEASGILRVVGYSEDQIKKIQIVITEHSYSLGREPSCIESAILQDADRLDALGAIGLMRVVTCGSRLGTVYYHLEDPFAKQRSLDDKRFTLDHFYVKLFKLADGMNTEMGKAEAFKRMGFMQSFIRQLKSEMGQDANQSL